MDSNRKKRKAEGEYSTNRSTKKNMAARQKATGEELQVILDKNATAKFVSTQWAKFKIAILHILDAPQNSDKKEFLESELRKQSKNIALVKR